MCFLETSYRREDVFWDKMQIFSSIVEIGLVPIVRVSSAESAFQAIEAIHRGGVRAAEITMTVPGAVRALEKLADRFGDTMILGAGTVLDPETARACMLAGAQFFVTPALNLATIEMAKRYSKAIFPGALTPTEVLTAWEAGADAIKIFPCSAVGGPKYIKALKAPFPQIRDDPDRRREPGHGGRFPEGGSLRGGGGFGTGGYSDRGAGALRCYRRARPAIPGGGGERTQPAVPAAVA